MKKLIIFSFLVVALLLGCNKADFVDNAQHVGISTVTYYVTFDLTGGTTVVFPKGNAYIEPGFVAKEVDFATQEVKTVTSKVKVTGTVDGNTIGLYTLTYSAVNADGYTSSVERTVIIYDPLAPATDLGGKYKCGIVRAPGGKTFVALNASITKLGPGFFYCSDFFGGFYDQGSGYSYGPGYAMTGYFLLNANNTITVVTSHIQGWGDSLIALNNAVYNPATNTIKWDAMYSSYDFAVTLVKQ
jgi:hypothetical protein